ncbi:MAG: peptidylprolyl isomerase [Candidatus Eisenbacteria bacterium]|nr:peptidylprolyl isomerase [Candidatus Eisenbacteria bacterium]
MNNRAAVSVALALFLAAAAGPVLSQEVDRIVAVVGETPVLASELREELAVYAAEPSLKRLPPDELRRMALNKLVEDRLFLAHAEDQGIRPSEEEVEEALEGSLDRMRSQFPTEEDFLAALASENLTLGELRRRYREEVEKSLTVRMAVDREVRWKTEATDAEVRRFYDDHLADLPDLPERYGIAQIFLKPNADSSAEGGIIAALEELRGRVLAGESFPDLAVAHSEGPSAPNGGDLGWFGRGDMDPAFEEATFAIAEPGGMSGVIRSRFGFHLIQLVARDGERVRARHILKIVPAGEGGWDEARGRAAAIMDSLRGGADFGGLAMRHSDDRETAARRGDVGVFAFSDVTGEMRRVLSELKPGEYSEPLETEDGVHIFLLKNRYEAGKPGFGEVERELRQAARAEKQQKAYDRFVENLKKSYYVEIKDGTEDAAAGAEAPPASRD